MLALRLEEEQAWLSNWKKNKLSSQTGRRNKLSPQTRRKKNG